MEGAGAVNVASAGRGDAAGVVRVVVVDSASETESNMEPEVDGAMESARDEDESDALELLISGLLVDPDLVEYDCCSRYIVSFDTESDRLTKIGFMIDLGAHWEYELWSF